MGGAHRGGNASASAEFNIWTDPEAAAVVFAAGIADVPPFPSRPPGLARAPRRAARCGRVTTAGTRRANASCGRPRLHGRLSPAALAPGGRR
jgi:hypothetical protein